MGSVESITGEFIHLRPDLLSNRFRDTVGNTARRIVFVFAGFIGFFVTMDKHELFSIQNITLFLCHALADHIGSSERVTSQLLHNLHNLFLIYNDSIGGSQNGFQFWHKIVDRSRIPHPLQVVRDIVHGPGPVECHSSDKSLETLVQPRLRQAVDIIKHRDDNIVGHAAAFQLEHATSDSLGKHLVGFSVIQRQVLISSVDAASPLNSIDDLMNG